MVSGRTRRKTVFDAIRKKHVADGPEERVRQSVLSFLVKKHGVPEGLISVETAVAGAAKMNRSDVVVFDRNGTAWMVIECKSPSIQIDQAGLDQAGRYNRHLKAPFLMITNGTDHFCCSVDHVNDRVKYLNQFPVYPKNV